MQSLHCPSCGAPLPVAHRFVKMVACDFCEQISLLQRGALTLVGKTATLTQLPSNLYLDATGHLNGRSFRILGRLQYAYEAGYWHEWFLVFEDGTGGWLQEDEGRYTFYQKETLTTAPSFEQVRVGERVRISGHQVFVTEKGEAQIVGGEGQLAFAILPGEQVRYIDGHSNGTQVSVEYTADEVELMVGQAIPRDALVLDDDF